jgi:hypothetical protein
MALDAIRRATRDASIRRLTAINRPSHRHTRIDPDAALSAPAGTQALQASLFHTPLKEKTPWKPPR